MQQKFKAVFHLSTGEAAADFLAIRQFDAETHVLVAPESAADGRIERMREVAGGALRLEMLTVDPLDFGKAADEIGSKAADFAGGGKLGFNVTGGTKPMTAAALQVCGTVGGAAYCLDYGRRQISGLANVAGESVPMVPAFDSVDAFFRLANVRVENPGVKAGDASKLTPNLKLLAKKFRQCPAAVAAANERRRECGLGEMDNRTAVGEIETALSDGLARCGCGETEAVMAAWREEFRDNLCRISDFLSGGWCEVWALQELVAQGGDQVRDLRRGVSLLPEDGEFHTLPRERSYGRRTGVVFTDGFSLALVDARPFCKPCRWMFDKLRLLADDLGRITARPVLAFPDGWEREDRESLQLQQNRDLHCWRRESGVAVLSGDGLIAALRDLKSLSEAEAAK